MNGSETLTEMAYYDCLFRIQNEMKNKSFLDMAKIWEKYFFDLRNNNYVLPLGLALCHETFGLIGKETVSI